MARSSEFDVHPSVRLVEYWIESMKLKTGRSLEEWLSLVQRDGPRDEADRRAWLKKEHGLGANAAGWLAHRSCGHMEDTDDPQTYLTAAKRYVEDMYAEKKAGLRPIHDRLLRLARELGDDVKICPCMTMVPFYREHVFAQVKPSTNTRIDLGFALKGASKKIPKRLIDTGGLAKNDRITHRIPLTSVAEIDDEVRAWLKIAYDLDAPKKKSDQSTVSKRSSTVKKTAARPKRATSGKKAAKSQRG